MQGIVYQFETFEELESLLHSDEPEVALPQAEGLCDGEWLLATFSVGLHSVSIAGKVSEHSQDSKLVFEERDWEKLTDFAKGGGPPSVPPPSCSSTREPIVAPPGTRVLVVDDNPALVKILQTMLLTSGVEVTCAASAEEAEEKLAREKTHLLVLDSGLPDMSGNELCLRLRKNARYANLAIMVLSTHGTVADSEEAFSAGADDFLPKPFRAPELRARVIGLLRRKLREAS